MKFFIAGVVNHRIPLFFTLALTALLTACASAPIPPTESMNVARDTIAKAEQTDARQYAGAELEEARAQLVMAEKAVTEESMTEADQLAKQASVAARLAMARTEAAKAAEINREMGRGADALDVEMGRQGEQK
ncbi:DUF4398 domain-containing protein [Marinobacter sp. M216]|uniref:DUF4398 domain-containing protein n=1 Tax=Marinobacter albus TaxID=3030833 RepID=A0ABT7HF15_9GAMM|nr:MULTISPECIES: DUF4398 domain-containing protein [unclassified Marinobacter]MBW7472411.1 DUF4398 domain-containing protein [Marinobacter sp. F4218]MDK9558961.1 DUF4398 domain-containing protein [Marinobacter sp. M216]